MKFRLLPVLGAACAFAVGTIAADKAASPAAIITTITAKKSAIAVGSGSIALVKGTKLEVLAREGDLLLVKFHAAQGKVPLADTDFLPENAERFSGQTPGGQQAATVQSATAPAAATRAEKALPAVAKQTAGQTPGGQQATTAPTPPPALSLDQKPVSNYGKMVQKAKQVEAAHNDKLVKPTDEILDEPAKK